MTVGRYMSTDLNGRVTLYYDEFHRAAVGAYNFLFDRKPNTRRNEMMAEMETVITWAEGEADGETKPR